MNSEERLKLEIDYSRDLNSYHLNYIQISYSILLGIMVLLISLVSWITLTPIEPSEKTTALLIITVIITISFIAFIVLLAYHIDKSERNKNKIKENYKILLEQGEK